MYFMLVLKVMFFNQYVVGFQVFSVRTRGRAVTIFNTCSTMIANMAEIQKVCTSMGGEKNLHLPMYKYNNWNAILMI